MKKRVTVLTLGAVLFALCLPVEAQQPQKIPRIGYLAQRNNATFKESVKARSQAVAMTAGAFLAANLRRIAEMAAKYRLPAIADRDDFVDRGGLMSYGADDSEKFKRVAVFIDKILKGTKPADIPVEQSSKFEFVVNLKTAKQLGVTIPPEVLARANRVIR
jgi:putative ABC transport system substrate-binding protein